MDLYISDFQIIKLLDQSIVVSEKGVALIHSPQLLQALYKLRALTSAPQAKTDIYTILEEYGLDANEAFEFLERVLKLRKTTLNLYFKQIIIAHDWSSDLEKILTAELPITFETHPINEQLIENIATPHAFLMIITKHYNHQKLKTIYFEIANTFPQSAICMALRVGDYFYVSQPYLSEAGTPCHFCNFDKTAYTEQVRPTPGNWSRLLNFCTDNNLPIPEQPLTPLQTALATGLLLETIKQWVCADYGRRTQDCMMLASYIHLSSGQITEEHVSHWSMCDCLGLPS